MVRERRPHDCVDRRVVGGLLGSDDDVRGHDGRWCHACEDLAVTGPAFTIRAALDGDRAPLAALFAAVAEERDGIATEPPVDLEARAASWTLDGTLVAVTGSQLIGSLHIDASRHGFGELGMTVAREWRGCGVGSALLAAGSIGHGSRASTS